MRLYPAIDIKDGNCVRLKQGLFKETVIYAKRPYEVAGKWEECGAEYLHLVDLDGALAGHEVNESVIKDIIATVRIPIQIGGGIRTAKDIERKLDMGISRVIIGTKAVENPKVIEEYVKNFGSDRIVIGIDAKDGIVAVNGWEQLSKFEAVKLAQMMSSYGVKNIVYTDIAKDGMLKGPNVEYTEKMVKASGINIIASGGVTTLDDLRKVETIGAEGAIIGKALYERTIDLTEAVRLFNTGKARG